MFKKIKLERLHRIRKQKSWHFSGPAKDQLLRQAQPLRGAQQSYRPQLAQKGIEFGIALDMRSSVWFGGFSF